MADHHPASEESIPSVSVLAPPDDILKFPRWDSRVDEEFWQRFAAIKLDSLQLDDKPLEIQGFFAPCSHAQNSNLLQLRAESLPTLDGKLDSSFLFNNRNQCPAPGTLYNTNTEEEFHAIVQAIARKDLLNKEAQKVWDDICSGRAIEDGRLLNRFFLITYADLKKWRFFYWFAFPALVLNPPATSSPLQPASHVLSPEEAPSVLVALQNWRGSSLSASCPFFLLHYLEISVVRARPLNEWDACQQEGGKVSLGFYDPCHLRTNPGWPLRNFLALAAVCWSRQHLQVLCYRERRGQANLDECLIVDVMISEHAGWRDQNPILEAVGWELNARQKMGPKMVDLASSMDPVRLARSAADLNLKLMRWRLLPSLDMDLLSKTKCLLLGAGTLGCQVARGLMAWGIRYITLVDCGRVAMSNPVRQSLYTFDDCLNGGKSKAVAAADNLRRIFPVMEAKGVQLTIPMPGHCVTESEASDVMQTCSFLQKLVDEHDVIFLLTDTRESRWLPTLLCANANKIAINAALGFDTYLVMRHGAGPCMDDFGSENKVAGKMLERVEPEKKRLGCYFCNDVVAPEDSTVNRTLDQQCTVTRPGVAPIAAAIAVELAVSLLHHPCGVDAPADKGTSPIVEPLGILPHQIRGFAANYSQLVIIGNAFNKCTACSSHIVAEYRQRGFDFLRQVFNQPKYLEDLTGLTDLLCATKNISIEWDNDSEETSDIEDLDML